MNLVDYLIWIRSQGDVTLYEELYSFSHWECFKDTPLSTVLAGQMIVVELTARRTAVVLAGTHV